MQKLRRNEVKRVTLPQSEDSRHDNYYARAYKWHTRRTRKLMRIVRPAKLINGRLFFTPRYNFDLTRTELNLRSVALHR